MDTLRWPPPPPLSGFLYPQLNTNPPLDAYLYPRLNTNPGLMGTLDERFRPTLQMNPALTGVLDERFRPILNTNPPLEGMLYPTELPNTGSGPDPQGRSSAMARKPGYDIDDPSMSTTAKEIVDTSTGGPSMNNGMDPLSGWAGTQGFNPAELAANIYTSPFYILPNVFKGMTQAGPGYQTLRNIGGDPLALYNIMQGGNRVFSEKSGVNDFTNWLRNMYANYGSRGGRAFNAQELLGNIFKQREGSQSSLANILRGAGEGGQANALYSLIRDVTGVGMNPLAGAGYNAAMQRAADAYGQARITSGSEQGANNMLITDWIRQNFPSLIPT
jgi:hypothetical protein